jgi:putative phosphoribosyl transferase
MPPPRPVAIPQEGGVVVHGELTVPAGAPGIVVFAHGSGSGRSSPRNRRVAASLQRRGLGTLLMDLLTEQEEAADLRTAHLRFDVELLAQRLAGAATWLAEQHPDPAMGLFGASTGAAAALVAAARRPWQVGAVVSRGGRPDLAGELLGGVRAPTLLIVGSRDEVVLQLNQQAYDRMRSERHLEVVPGASHLFEEPGALDEVARLAGDWFAAHLGPQAGAPAGPHPGG